MEELVLLVRALVFTARAEYSPSLLTRATPTRELIEQKPHAGELVVGWVTTSESSLLYVRVHPIFFFVRKLPLAALIFTPFSPSPEYPAYP
ncbi:L-lysine 2-3-aminomutase [Penicillium chrysogenum]|uniref:L-lysine 2-3-aminomutase n=1 Tax=Penicillium chrysogenum TaxID=5076 RepID=A0ABQ8WAH7_PENCH|nr:L-lysine 2-3-aminomutase [Penicillium chrysogenum]KAJ5237922.1 L-lysine 2-3-aminomutase [Penicillium chrysogenum]KAJ5261820.1 L-lysine 2-3-aminomutase [Penicillium chrysogenum]